MTDPADPKPTAPRRQPTVQSGGGSLFGHRDDRWDDGPSRISQGAKSRWIDRIAKPADRLKPPPAWPSANEFKPAPGAQPAPASVNTPPAPGSAATPSSRLAQLAATLALLAFALAANSIVLPLIALVLWVQRRKIAPNFQPPWEDPATVKDWLDRYGPKPSAGPKLIDRLLLKWLNRPPYQDPAALKAWVRIRLASVLITAFGALFIVRLLLRLMSPTLSGDGGTTI